jgi:glycosyltransferase involved in cell wall biosynthesis
MLKISSPVPSGSGAYIMHKSLERRIKGYQVIPYNPYWTLFPPALRFFRDRSADLVHAIADYSIFSCMDAVPLVATFHSYNLDPELQPYNSPAQRLHYSTDLKLFVKLALQRADCVTAVSHFIAKKIREDLGYRDKIRVIHNGIDADIFSPRPGKHAGDTVRVLFVGNLTRRKGADMLPAIAGKLDPGVQIRYTTGFRKSIRVFPSDKLVNIGSLPHGAMPAVYNESDVLLFPSVREGFGLAVAEAMACGLPVVTSAGSSLPELIDDGKGGFLCGIGDAEMFAEKINHLAHSPQLRSEMGEYNRDKVERMFTLDRMARDYLALFEEVRS